MLLVFDLSPHTNKKARRALNVPSFIFVDIHLDTRTDRAQCIHWFHVTEYALTLLYSYITNQGKHIFKNVLSHSRV